MRAAAMLFLVACGHAVHEPTPQPLPAIAHRASRTATPGAKLAALRDLVPPPDWVEEQPDLDGIWPESAASQLRETWVKTTVCREASWNAPLADVSSHHHVFAELRARVAGDERVEEATLERGGARLSLKQERFCILHECRPPLSAPLTSLAICVDGVETKGASAILMKRRPSLAPLVDLLALEGLSELTAQYKRALAGDEVEIGIAATPDGQARLREWLLSHHYGARTRVDWQIDSTDPSRTFILYPPDKPESVVAIWGR